jgi:hypothetical protein
MGWKMNISIDQAARIIVAIRNSGRLRKVDQPVLARALSVVLERRDQFPDDAEEALVQAVASLVVADTKKLRA